MNQLSYDQTYITFEKNVFYCSSNTETSLDDIEDQIGEPISNLNKKRFVINDKLFIQRPSEIEKSRTPVCDFIYRDEAGAKFYTGLSQKQRQILWEFLGPAKHNLQVWGRRAGFINSEIRSLSVECQFLLCLIILRRDKAFEECHHLFGISDTVASQVFKTWLSFLKVKLKAVETYVHSLTLKDLPKPPKAFRNKLLRKVRYVHRFSSVYCRCVLDVYNQYSVWYHSYMY